MMRYSPSNRWTFVHRFPPSLLVVTLLPMLLNGQLCLELWQGLRAQAWDGSGHYALAEIYSQSIFPETFGWTLGYFAGVAFPNFYPPLFYFLVALVTHTHLLSFAAAFKLVLVVPTLVLPAVIWWLAYRLSRKDRIAATWAAMALMPLLVDSRFSNSTGLIGLSHTSTFLLGLYTQPLGFVLLIAWYVSYVCPISFSLSVSAATAPGRTERQPEVNRTFSRFALSAVLLALALLANFFSSNVALLMVGTVVAYDLFKLWRERQRRGSILLNQRRRVLLPHLVVPVYALLLTMFWLSPLINSYAYVVTRPIRVPLNELVPPIMWGWYALAALGAYLWIRRQREGAHLPFLATCVLLFIVILCGGTIAPRWLPFHSPRLTSTLNFMLAVPVGQAITAVVRRLGSTAQYVALVAAIALLFIVIDPSQSRWAFYDSPEWARVAPVLRFAEQHRDGRYLVENLAFTDIHAAHDARAINAYLGAQGNEVLSLFFREGAANVLFLNPLVDSLSTQSDSYGISSVLVDDTEYASQSLHQHLEQARMFGAKYIVVHSQSMKAKLGAEGGLTRYELGQWSVFDLGGESAPMVRALAYKPALVVSDFSLKLRKQSSYDFIRFAEEQFASGRYDVLLARAPETKLDRLEVAPGFGALVVATYSYDNEDRATERLKEFAQTRLLLLLSSEDHLFKRIKADGSEFPHVEFIERPKEVADGWIEAEHPTGSYASTGPRMVWKAIQTTLEKQKLSVKGGGLSADVAKQVINIRPNAESSDAIPVAVASTFHPNWRRSDGGSIYATTPFFMLTFVDQPVTITFRRAWPDRLGLWVSVAALAGFCAIAIASYRRRYGEIV